MYQVIYSAKQFDSTINLTKEELIKNIEVDGNIRKLEYLFTQWTKSTSGL